MKRNMLALVAIIAAVLFAVTGLEAAEYVPGHLVVKLEHGILEMSGVDEVPISQVTIHDQELAQALQGLNTQSVERVFKGLLAQPNPTAITRSGQEVQLKDLSQVYLFRMDRDLDVYEVAEQLEQLPAVIYAHPNYIVELFSRIPDDWDFEYDPEREHYQWGLNNTTYPPGYWDINAPEAWEIETGREEILLAIIDTGLEQAHCDASNDEFTYAKAYDRIYEDEYYRWNRDYNVYEEKDASLIFDNSYNSHGTNVIGIAAANTNDGAGEGWPPEHGIAGVAGGWRDPDPELDKKGVSLVIADMPHYDLPLNPNTEYGIANVAQAIVWATGKGAHVLNGSWGYTSDELELEEEEDIEAMRDAIENAFLTDMTLFFAAGNSGSVKDVSFPASLATYDICCAVGNMNPDGERYSTSSYKGTGVSFVAPGVDIFSTGNHWVYQGTDDWYFAMTGTSQASAHAAGVAALLYSQAEERGYDLLDVDCKRIMEISARDCQYVRGDEVAIEGWDEYTGYGCIDAYAALSHLRLPYMLVHNTITNQGIHLSWIQFWVEIKFTNPPLPELDTGRYHCSVYALYGVVNPPMTIEQPWIWGRLLDGEPGYSSEDPNDAWFQVDVIPQGSDEVNLLTYVYELWEYYDEGEGRWVPVEEQYRWAPRPLDEVSIAYTMIYHASLKSGPAAVDESALEPEIAVVGSNLGGSITVHYQLPQPTDTRITVYDVTGREVTTLVSGEQPAGEHELVWKGHDDADRKVSSGVYFVRMETENYQSSKKITLLR